MLKTLLESELVANVILIFIGAFITFLGGVYKERKERKEKEEYYEYEKHIFFIKLNHELTLFLESLDESPVFLTEFEEFNYYEKKANKFLKYLEELKDMKFDRQTTNYLYKLYHLQRNFVNDTFKYDEYIIEPELTPTGYPEKNERIYIDRNIKREYTSKLENINNQLNERIYCNEKSKDKTTIMGKITKYFNWISFKRDPF